MPENISNLICQKIVSKLPYILYNDDFNDRPINEVLTDSSEKQKEWYNIFERVFNSVDKDYSLKTIFDIDERRKESIISDIENFLSTTLTNTWSKFSPNEEQVSISLKLKSESNSLFAFTQNNPD